MSRVVSQNSLTPQGNNNLNFRLTRIEQRTLKSRTKLCASLREAN